MFSPGTFAPGNLRPAGPGWGLGSGRGAGGAGGGSIPFSGVFRSSYGQTGKYRGGRNKGDLNREGEREVRSQVIANLNKLDLANTLAGGGPAGAQGEGPEEERGRRAYTWEKVMPVTGIDAV